MHLTRVCVCVCLLCGVACDDAPKETASGSPDKTAEPSKGAEPKDGDAQSADGKQAKPVAAPSEITLAKREQRPAAPTVDAAQRPIEPPTRAPIAWRPPAHWTPRRDAGKPFVLGEYGLPEHTEDKPAICRLVSNSGKTKGDTPAEQADREVRRTRIKTPAGKSVLSLLQPKVETIAGKPWHFVMIEGSYRPVKGVQLGTDVKDLVPGYAQINFVPEIPGALFYVRCWGPAATIKEQEAAIRGWVAAIEYPAS